MEEPCGDLEAVLGRSWVVLVALRASCGDLSQSWGRLKTVLKRCWEGLRVVLEHLGVQDAPKTHQGDPKDAPMTRHVAPGDPQDAPRYATKTPGNHAERTKSIEKQSLLALLLKSEQSSTERCSCRSLGTVLGMLWRSVAILGPSRRGLGVILTRSWGSLGPSCPVKRPQDVPRRHQDAPTRRHVGAGSAQDASRCHQEAYKGDGEAQKY